MALDLGLTTHQTLSTPDGVVLDAHTRGHRLDDAVERALDVPTDEAAFRTSAVGRRPYISARTGPEGLLGTLPPPELPQDWTAISVDGPDIDVGHDLPVCCHLINLGSCIIAYVRVRLFGILFHNRTVPARRDAKRAGYPALRPPSASGDVRRHNSAIFLL